MSTTRHPIPRAAVAIVIVIALLLAATSAYLLFVPVDSSDLESATGATWESFTAVDPAAADYLAREARVLAVGYLGFALLVAAVAWVPLRRGDPWAVRALWLFPATLLGTAAVFLSSGATTLGGTYLGAGALAAAALVTVARRPDVEAGV